MPDVQVRPFRRADRERLTALVNAHIQAVVPGLSVSASTVLSQLERDPGEFIVDPWVAERVALVATQRGRVVAAAHLLRYDTGEEVGEAVRGGGDISWLLYWPEASYRPDSTAAADAEEAGTRLSGLVGDELVGFIEVETNLAEGGRLAHLGGWADVGNLHVREAYRRRGVATWLVGQAADWLRLARVERLLEYAWPEAQDLPGLLGRVGFRELTRTARGWHHRPGPGSSPEATASPEPRPSTAPR